jgi:hypothetical protein
MKTTSRLLALLGSSLLAALPGAHAQQAGSPMYAVELIVFRVTSPSGNEDMSAVPPGRGFGNESTRGGGTPHVLRILPASDYRLAGVENTLRGSGAWRPIAHAAWIQTAANWGTHMGIALGDLGINTPGLSGMVFLERATYLHLGLELTLNSGGISYTIKEMRSVKYNERQYFDHPAFGVIAVVSPVNANSGSGAAPH